jgi:predicted ATPase
VYLLLHRDQPLARGTVALLFWPDLPESEARARLRYDMRDLRAALPPSNGVPWIVADTRTMRWNPDAAIWFDVAEYERLAADPLTAVQAVELYGGDLADRLDDEWLQGPRDRLRELQRSLLWALVVSNRAQGHARGALVYAQRLAQHDPVREDSVRTLIELRYETGDRAGALQTYRDFVARLREELDVEPMSETTTAYERVLNAVDAPALPAAAPRRHNLPEAMTSFVGRDTDVETLRTTLSHRRLLTLVGAGGVGKSRLSVEVARSIVERYADGVWLIELAPLVDPGLIVSAIGTALGFQDSTEASLLAALQDKRLLLLLDNCEHLIEAAASIVDRLVKACPHLHILATSREPLRVEGERTERVVSLALPEVRDGISPSVAELADAPAVRLFLDRAADVAPEFRLQALEENDRRALAVISHRLDGIPLAIEFAAARVSSLTLTVLAQLLDDRFALLTAGKRTALPRQQTLRATMDWSYALLPALEQRVLQRVGIFIGGWTLEAASVVCSDESVTKAGVVASLGSLVDKSLVVMESGPLEQPRYHLLETTRAYALEGLTMAGDLARMARRHAEFFARFCERFDQTWQTLDQRHIEVGAALRLDLDNWRAVLKWAIDDGNDLGLGASVIGSLRWVFVTLALYAEGDRWCERALTALGPDPNPTHEATVQLALATMRGTFPFHQRSFYLAGTAERSLQAAVRAAELFRIAGDDTRLSLALSMVAIYRRLTNRSAGADAAASEAAKLARSSERRMLWPLALYATSFLIEPAAIDERKALLTEAFSSASALAAPYARESILMALSELAFEAGDPTSALIQAKECQTACEGFVSWANRAELEINIAAYSLATGERDEADAAARRALAIGRQIGEPMVAATTCLLFAGVAVLRDDLLLAARLLGASDARLARGQPRLFTEQWVYDWTMSHLSNSLPKSEIEALMSEGRSWNVDHAIAYIEAP